jgi:hypothetical protein
MHRTVQKAALHLAFVVMGVTLILFGAPSPAGASMPVAIRPISDFVDAQGTSSVFFPPFPDQIGWVDNPATIFALADYSGKGGEWLLVNGGPDLGTQTSGTITDRPLKGGRSLVTVALHTTNAVTFAYSAPAFDLIFGNPIQDLAADPSLMPALSDCHLGVVFQNTAPGAPLPDLVNWLAFGNSEPGQELNRLSFRSDGNGPIHAAYGVPEGTPGLLVVTQTGLFGTGFHGAVGDAFPAESIYLNPTGP